MINQCGILLLCQSPIAPLSISIRRKPLSAEWSVLCDHSVLRPDHSVIDFGVPYFDRRVPSIEINNSKTIKKFEIFTGLIPLEILCAATLNLVIFLEISTEI